MAVKDLGRAATFPAIEKRYGKPMSYWFAVMAKVKGAKYPEQIGLLRDKYGFSAAHANALVMYSRGSKSAKRFTTLAQYYKTINPHQVKTVKRVFKASTNKYPKLELVIVWNQPMLKMDSRYVFGVSVTKNYILIAPWSTEVISKFAPKLTPYKVNKKTIAIPNDWQVDEKLLQAMVKARLAE